jgi:hypothetical protein
LLDAPKEAEPKPEPAAEPESRVEPQREPEDLEPVDDEELGGGG